MRAKAAIIAIAAAAMAGPDAAAQDDTAPAGAAPAPTQLAEYPSAPHEDRRGRLWIGTVGEGLIRYDGRGFVTFTTEDGLGDDSVRDILEDDDGTLWFATTGGLTRHADDTFTTLTEYEPMPITPGFSAHGHHRDLWDVHIDRDGDLWIATTGGVFQHDGDKFSRFEMPVVAPQDKAEFAPAMVYCVFEDDEGDLWFGTDGAGVVRYDGDEFVVYTMRDHGLCSDHVCAILQDARGEYWFGTSNGGVSRFDGETFTTVLRSERFSRHTGWGRYMSILEDREGHVWFGVSAQGGGVYRYDGDRFERFAQAEGLGDGGVPSLRKDRSGRVWLGTTAGVYWFDGARFVNFTKSELDDADPEPLRGWASETFALPPGFAPGLPTGRESLRFSPGWRDPEAEGFWSYAFVMWIDEPAPDAARLGSLLEDYYNGLMSALAGDRDIGNHPARVEVERLAPGRFEASMGLIDAFATFEPIELRVVVDAASQGEGRSVVRVRVSPQPADHPIWRSLDTAIGVMERVR